MQVIKKTAQKTSPQCLWQDTQITSALTPGKITKVQHSCVPGLVALCYKMPLSLCTSVCLMYIYVHSDRFHTQFLHRLRWCICLQTLTSCTVNGWTTFWHHDKMLRKPSEKVSEKLRHRWKQPLLIRLWGVFMYLQSGINCSPPSGGHIGYNYRLQLGSLQGNSRKQNVLHS